MTGDPRNQPNVWILEKSQCPLVALHERSADLVVGGRVTATNQAGVPKRSKKQHYVPQLHLRQFEGENPRGMLWVYEKGRPKPRPAKAKETAAENNFYSAQTADGEWVDILDDWLTDMEGRAAPVYEALLEGRIPEGQERADFATFVSSLFVRTPAAIRAAAEVVGHGTQMINEMLTSSRELFESHMNRYEEAEGPIGMSRDELWDFMSDKSGYTIQVSQKRGLSVMGASDRIQGVIFDLNWSILQTASSDDYFITGDMPVCRYTAGQIGGFFHPEVEVTLPLSPSCALLMSREPLSSPLYMPSELVWRFNEMRVHHAHRGVYSPRRDDRVQALVNLHRDSDSGFRVNGRRVGPEVEVLARLPPKPE